MIKETLDRLKKPTPNYFKKVINIGITLGVIGTAIAAAPVALPAAVVTLGGYLATAGVIAAAVAKTTVDK